VGGVGTGGGKKPEQKTDLLWGVLQKVTNGEADTLLRGIARGVPEEAETRTSVGRQGAENQAESPKSEDLT